MEFFTIGVYNSTEKEFFEKLTQNNIDTFCDIRQRRGVRGSKYSFVNSNRLQQRLNDFEIKYGYVPDLAPTTEIRELQKEIDEGHFRNDLFYRLAVFQIHLPALRERVIDIEALANHFANLFSAKTNQKIKSLSPDFIEALKQHQWNGNIRELKNILERSVILSNASELTPDTLPVEMQLNPTSKKQNGKTLSAFDLASAEKLHIQKVLNYTNGNKTEAAKLLNIALTTLYRKLDDYNIG